MKYQPKVLGKEKDLRGGREGSAKEEGKDQDESVFSLAVRGNQCVSDQQVQQECNCCCSHECSLDFLYFLNRNWEKFLFFFTYFSFPLFLHLFLEPKLTFFFKNTICT